MSKKLMIMGGTGFLGYHTALLALKKGYEVASISIKDIDLEGWYPKEIKNIYCDVFKASEEELTELMKGYDYMIYSIGPDDRDTPPAPAYEFFKERLVDHCAKAFRAAEKAGVKKAAVYNSYFTHFNVTYPELRMAEQHPYIRARVEQAELLLKQKTTMEVVILELPYIFGKMPGREPLWKKTFLEPFAYGKKKIMFPDGSTTMTNVSHIAEAGIGAIEYGKDGEYYPIGDENHTYDWMLDQMMMAGLGRTKKIVHPAVWMLVLGTKFMKRANKKKGLEAGLDLSLVMSDIMSNDVVIKDEVMDRVNKELHISRGGLEQGIQDTMDVCYPNKSFK